MTLDEKIAQTLAVWQQKRMLVDASGNFDPSKAAAVLKDGIGQITRVSDGIEHGRRRVAARDGGVRQRDSEVGDRAHAARHSGDVPRGGAARPGGHEGHELPGANRRSASTWDPALVERVFTVAAREARSRGAQQVLAPVIDLARDPRWGRTEETYGEDPHPRQRDRPGGHPRLQGPMPALTPGHVFATAKHYAGARPHEGGINTAPTQVPERELREELLWPFERAITEGDVAAVMPSYNEIDGVPSHAKRVAAQTRPAQGVGLPGHHRLRLQRDRAARRAPPRRRIDGRGRAKLAIEAGVDFEMPDRGAYLTLADQVKAGQLDERLVDAAAGAHAAR